MQMLDGSTLTNTGLLSVTNGTTFYLNDVTLAAGSTFAGTGLLNMNGGTHVTADITVTVPVTLSGTLDGAGRMRMAAPMTWSGGTLSLQQGLDIQAGQTLTFSNTNLNRGLSSGTSLRNFGTVTWAAGGGGLLYTGSTITVRNESGALWTYGAGGYGISNNGDPNPLGSFTFVNNGTMSGAGNPTTTVTVTNRITFSGSGSTSNMNLFFAP
jgi:hypothetical protein